MESRRSRNLCLCPRPPLRFSSTLLFLSWILPSSSFAQLTSSTSSTNIPTTLLTSTLPSSPPSTNALPTETVSAPPSATTAATSSNPVGDHAFNYYFLIVAAAAVFFCLLVLWFGRRKKRKAAIMRSQSQRALARDVEGWRTRFRAGLGGNIDEGGLEGLDERGEAPPPYAPGSKPPSIRTHRDSMDSGNGGQAVELRRLSRDVNRPPRYHEAANTSQHEDIGDIARPAPAIMASEGFRSTRRLLSDTRSSS